MFDLRLVDYASTTEESQHFSGTFNRFAAELVDEIAERYDLEGRETLEIGCGKGDFLQELVAKTYLMPARTDIAADRPLIADLKLLSYDAAAVQAKRKETLQQISDIFGAN